MCLSDIAQVVAVDRDRHAARAVIGARTVDISTVALGLDDEPVEVGEWLVVHTGLAVERLTEHDARRILGERARLAGPDQPRQESP